MSMGNEHHISEEEQFSATIAEFLPEQDSDAAPEQKLPEAPQSAATEQEPFEGFSQLPESARAKFTETIEQAKRFERELEQQRRQYGALSGRVPALQRQLDEYKKRTAAAPSSAPAQTKAEAWEAYKAMFPDEAKAIEERQAQIAADFGGKLSPLEQQIKELAAKTERFEQMAQEAENEQIQEALTELVPDWKIIAGWEDRDGNELDLDANGKIQMHPEFKAWVGANPDWKKRAYVEALNSRDPYQMAAVFMDFKRDYHDALVEEGYAQSAQQLPQGRRQQALRDVTPTGGVNGLADRSNAPIGHMTEEEQYAATVARYADRWASHG